MIASFILITLIAVSIIFLPLVFMILRKDLIPKDLSYKDKQIYLHHLDMLEKDLQNGKVLQESYQQQKAEIAKRLLRLADDPQTHYSLQTDKSTILLSVVMIFFLIFLTSITYIKEGSYFLVEAIEAKSSNLLQDSALLEKKVQKEPNNSVAWFELAVHYARKRQFTLAIEAAENSVKFSPDRVEPLHLLANLYEQENATKKLEMTLKKIIDIDGKNVEALWKYAMLSLQNGNDANETRARFAVVLPLMPNDAKTTKLKEQIGRMLLRLDDIQEQIKKGIKPTTILE